MTETLLIVDDDVNFRTPLKRLLEGKGFLVLEAGSCAEAFQVLKKEDVDLIILDYQLPDGDGLGIIEKVKKLAEGTEVILITGVGTIELAVGAMKNGAVDFIQKPFDFSDLEERIHKALEFKQLKAVSEYYASSQDDISLIGNSEKMAACIGKANNVAKTEMAVFLQGETGTGKELMARYIHLVSSRKNKPLVAVNCANPNIQFLNDELFGHEKGSYTDAFQIRKGKIELADSGTLFLDEIGDMPLELQGALLRFLQDKNYSRCGSEKERKFRGRVIVATNRNMEEMVALDKFRKDLYFRLKAYSIILPPLRERREDIPVLVEFFLKTIRTRLSQPSLRMDEKVMDFLIGYQWPGNVRELQFFVEEAATNARGEILQIKHFSLFQSKSVPMVEVQLNVLDAAKMKAEKTALISALEKSGWNQTKAANLLNINRIRLIRLMRKHDIAITKGPAYIDQKK